MENGVEALKIAFAIMMLIMALSLSISSFSRANQAVTSIVNLNDRETEYNYINPQGLTRTVGVETIVPIMYKAYKENFEVRFYDRDGEPITIYYETDATGNLTGNEVTSIDGSEVFGSAEEAKKHLDQILGPDADVEERYKEQIYYTEGFYDYLLRERFTEELGEYYQNDSEDTPEANKTKKRIIIYTQI